jgi:hypothetical protein
MAARSEIGWNAAAAEQAEFVTSRNKMARHGRAHNAKADKSDFRHRVYTLSQPKS